MGSVSRRAYDWVKTRVIDPVQEWLKEGAEPNILARSAGIGFGLGLCPLLGVSTLLCLGMLFLAKLARLEMHPAMALLANLLAVPVELALIVTHMRVGEWVLGAPHLEVVKIRLSDLWKGDLAADLLYGIAHAMLGWLLLLPVESAVVGFGTLPLFSFLKKKFHPHEHERLVEYSSDEELELGLPKGARHTAAARQQRAGSTWLTPDGGPPVVGMGSLRDGDGGWEDDEEGWEGAEPQSPPHHDRTASSASQSLL